jgi:hypothetical protein
MFLDYSGTVAADKVAHAADIAFTQENARVQRFGSCGQQGGGRSKETAAGHFHGRNDRQLGGRLSNRLAPKFQFFSAN